jgi:hypothetical protein
VFGVSFIKRKWLIWGLVLLLALPMGLFSVAITSQAAVSNQVVISDFESSAGWNSNIHISQEKQWNLYSAHKWMNMDDQGSGSYPGYGEIFQKQLSSTTIPTADWTSYNRLSFKMKVDVPPSLADQKFWMVLQSGSGSYYSSEIPIGSDTAWQQVTLDLDLFSTAGTPAGWNQIDTVRFHPNRTGSTSVQIDPDMVVFIDNLVVGQAPTGLTLNSSAIEVGVGSSYSLDVTATMPDSSTENVTSNAMYTSSDPAVATVDDQGNVTGVIAGTSVITTDYMGVSTTVNVTVDHGLIITPANFYLNIGEIQALTVTADYGGGSTTDVTASATYSSSNTAVATVSAEGAVSAVDSGTAQISVSYDGQTAEVTANVNWPDATRVDNFETTGIWGNLTITNEQFIEGSYSGKWENMGTKKSVGASSIPHDWSGYDSLDFWVYSVNNTNQNITVLLYSNNAETTQTDYYSSSFNVDWAGSWKKISIPFSGFSPAYSPAGMQQIDSIKFHSSWSGDPVDPNTIIYFDDMNLTKQLITTNPQASASKEAEEGTSVTYKLEVTNNTTQSDSFTIIKDESQVNGMTASLSKTETVSLGVKEKDTFDVTVNAPGSSAGTMGILTVTLTSVADASITKSVTLHTSSVTAISKINTHPNVWVNQNEVDAAKTKINDYVWASDFKNILVEQADIWLNKDITAPTLPAGHGSFFVCPNNNDVQLTYTSENTGSFYCNDDGQYYSGSSIDAGWRYFRYRELAEAAKLLGEVYVLTDNVSYAQRGRDILTEITDWNANFSKQSRGGTLTWTTLDQSVLLTYFAQAYDLIYKSAVVSNSDKFNIERNFLKPNVEILKDTTVAGGLSNFHAWHNAAYVTVGAAINDVALIDYGINGPYGFYFQMANSVWDDGFWYEGSPAYHAYSLQGYAILAETAYHNGYNLYTDAKFKSMIDALVDVPYPNLQIPTVNDGGTYGYTWLADSKSLELEVPYARIGDSKYAWLLNEKYMTNGLPRKGIFALFHGIETIPAASYELTSKNFGDVNNVDSGIGFGILRQGIGTDKTNILLDYGPFGGSHGHYDKMNIDIYGKGMPLAPDLGTPSYASQYYRDYYKTTLGHNTIVLNEMNQKRRSGASDNDTSLAEVSGRMNLFSVNYPEFQIMQGFSDPTDMDNQWGGAYEYTRYKRMVAVTPDYSIDLFRVGSTLSGDTTSRTYDYVLHGLGTFNTPLTMSSRPVWSDTIPGYKFLQNPVSAALTGDNVWNVTWTQGNTHLKMTMLDKGDSEVIKADAPGMTTTDLQPVLLVRKNDKTWAEYTAILESYTDTEGTVQTADRIDNYNIHVALTSGVHDYFYYNNSSISNGSVVYGFLKNSSQITPSFATATVDSTTMDITYTPEAGTLNAIHVFYGSGVTNVNLNGSPVSFEKSANYIIVDCK